MTTDQEEGISTENEHFEAPWPQRASPVTILAVFAGLFFLCNLLGGGLTLLMARLAGINFQEAYRQLSGASPVGSRNFVRAVLLVNHLFSFILPAALTAWIFYRKNAPSELYLRKTPDLRSVLLAAALLIVSIPCVEYLYALNMKIHLPGWMNNMEEQSDQLIKGILTTDRPYEFIFNLFLIAIIPAIGEEMVFRGTIQKQLSRIIPNPHVAIWTSAAIFSAVHFQFQGFFARMFLGALLGYLLYWTKNLWVPMAAHFLNNGLQVAGLYFSGLKASDLDKLQKDSDVNILMALASLVMVVGIGHFFTDHYLDKAEST